MKAVITLLIIGLTAFLWGCGDDTEETASVQIPVLLKNVTVEGTYVVKVAITSTGIKPITTEQDLVIQTDRDKVYITVDEVSRDREWFVEIDMRLISNDEIVVYQGHGQLLFSDRELANLSPITVNVVGHQFVARFELTSEARLTEVGYLENGHITVDATQSKDTIHGISAVKWEWGDGQQTEYSQELTAKHTYIKAGNYLVTLTVKNNAPVPESTVYQKVVPVAVQQKIHFETDGAVMHLIPAGEFEMGDHFGDGQSDELPVHTVSLDAFYMDETEVTNAKYKAFTEATGHRAPFHWRNPELGDLLKPHFPVIYVSWHDAMTYAKWAGKRLPTEAEWEYAARGGQVGQRYSWGNEVSHDHANYSGEAERDRWYWPAPVKRFPQNDYGLYDMAGNVWEWCLDEYQKDFYATSPRNNPVAGGLVPLTDDNFRNLTSHRVWRGGAWDGGPKSITVSNRSKSAPHLRVLKTGFRCVFPVNSQPLKEAH